MTVKDSGIKGTAKLTSTLIMKRRRARESASTSSIVVT